MRVGGVEGGVGWGDDEGELMIMLRVKKEGGGDEDMGILWGVGGGMMEEELGKGVVKGGCGEGMGRVVEDEVEV